MNTEQTTMEKFIGYVKTCIDDKGVYPYPGWLVGTDNKLSVLAMDLKPDEVYAYVMKLGNIEKPVEAIFGLDRFNKEGQGIDMHFASVFTIICFNIKAMSCEVVVLPYNSKDDIGEPQYDNKWWIQVVGLELKQYFEISLGKN